MVVVCACGGGGGKVSLLAHMVFDVLEGKVDGFILET